MPTPDGQPSPQDAPAIANATGFKLFATSNTAGDPEGNIDPLNLPVSTATAAAIAAGAGNGAADVKYCLMMGQSNVNSSREATTGPAFDPVDSRVKIWDRRDSALEVWDAEILSPNQHSWLVDDAPTARPLWPRILAKLIANDGEGKELRVISSTISGTGLHQWISQTNGGTDGGGQMYSNINTQMAAAGFPRFDYVFFDQGETAPIGFGDQTAAMTAFYDQAISEGWIDQDTIIIAREVRTPLTSNTAIQDVFVARHPRAYAVPKSLFNDDATDYDGENDVHLLGQNHFVVADDAFAYLQTKPKAAPIVQTTFSETDMVPVFRNGVLISIPMSDARAYFLAGPPVAPASPEILLLGSDFNPATTVWSDTSGNSWNLTSPLGVDADIALESGYVALNGLAGNNTLNAAAGYSLPASGDWTIGMRVKIEAKGPGTSQNVITYSNDSTIDPADAIRFYHIDSTGTLRLRVNMVDVVEFAGVSYSSLPKIITIRKSGTDYSVILDGVEATGTTTAFTVATADQLWLGFRASDPSETAFDKIAIYHSSLPDTGTNSIEQLASWLSVT